MPAPLVFNKHWAALSCKWGLNGYAAELARVGMEELRALFPVLPPTHVCLYGHPAKKNPAAGACSYACLYGHSTNAPVKNVDAVSKQRYWVVLSNILAHETLRRAPTFSHADVIQQLAQHKLQLWDEEYMLHLTPADWIALIKAMNP